MRAATMSLGVGRVAFAKFISSPAKRLQKERVIRRNKKTPPAGHKDTLIDWYGYIVAKTCSGETVPGLAGPFRRKPRTADYTARASFRKEKCKLHNLPHSLSFFLTEAPRT